MVKIIDGKKLAAKIENKIVNEIYKTGKRPNLAIILIGDRSDSKLYVDLKQKEAKYVGIDTHLYEHDKNISEQELLEMVDFLNKDKNIDAILIQLPLPDGFDTDTIIMAMDPKKDIDGFHPDNLENLLSSCEANIMPPVFGVVLEIVRDIKFDLKNKIACVLSNSDIFGKSLAHILKCRGAEILLAGPDDKDLAEKTNKADILITAVGRPGIITGDMVKEGVVLIDIGITKKDKKVLGDVDFDSVKEKAGYITPVPGGVGPMTIAMAFKNTLDLFKKKK